MPEKQAAPCGTWRSPLHAEEVAAGTRRLGAPRLSKGAIYWRETRPAEGGRGVIVRHRNGETDDLIAPPYNARTRVHEYGGGDYFVADGVVFFSHFDDQRLYRVVEGREPEPLTPAEDLRYADACLDARRRRILCVREDHRRAGSEPINAIVALPLDGVSPGDVLVTGSDFYSSPRLSPDGRSLAWLCWNHPQMPWDAAALWVAPVRADGSLGAPEHVAGGPDESVAQPEWSPDGVLHFVSDRTDWWNLYRFAGGRIEALAPLEAEFAVPHWLLGASCYAFAGPTRLVTAYTRNGVWTLARLDTETRRLETIETPFTAVADVAASERCAVFVGASPDRAPAIVCLDRRGGGFEILRSAETMALDAGCVSPPQPVTFPTGGGARAHGLYYAPANPDYAPPRDEKPPLLVRVHGGPTAAAGTARRLDIQYYTSRGWAVLDVNYRGSTGYGRTYRRSLYGRWGEADVDDCVHGARYLVEQGLADARRLAIAGGSAGGYTVLAALAFRDVFAAGASRYGISDCEVLARETHKFESRYLDALIGPYPERRDRYLARSPLHHLEGFRRPVIFFQGLEDPIVPPNQTERMAAALRERGVPVAYLSFEGEQHGFRRAENIRRALEAELYFFSRVFGIEPADPIEPVEIANG